MLHRAFQSGYNRDPPLVGRVPFFPKLTEDEPRKGFLKPEHYHTDTQAAGRKAEEVLAREHEVVAQIVAQTSITTDIKNLKEES